MSILISDSESDMSIVVDSDGENTEIYDIDTDEDGDAEVFINEDAVEHGNDRVEIDIRAEVDVVENEQSELEQLVNLMSPTREILSELPMNSGVRVDNNPESGSSSAATGSLSSESKRVFKSSPEKAKSTVTKSPEPDDDDSQCCPICFDSWTTSGEHRLVSLKCGHLFGKSCVEKWIKGTGTKRCPQCNVKAKKADIRIIYAKALMVLDTSERDLALKALETEKLARRRAELETAQARAKYQMVFEEARMLKAQIEKEKQAYERLGLSKMLKANVSSFSETMTFHHKFVFQKSFRISDTGNCRVFTYCSQITSLIISQPSANPLFPGFGVRVFSLRDLKNGQFIFLHSKPIRDIAVDPTAQNGLLLSASMDKTIKVTSLLTKLVVQTYQANTPIWSCAWNTDDKHFFYAGLTNGTVMVFDIRKPDEPAYSLNVNATSRAPVVALQYVPKNAGSLFKQGGLLVGQLDVVSFYEATEDNDNKLHLLPLEGSLTSLSFDVTTRNFLATFRPNTKYPSVRHVISEFTYYGNVCSSKIVKTILGSNTMRNLSRSHLFPNPNDVSKLMVCAGDEATVKTMVWDVQSMNIIEKLELGGEPVMDLKTYNVNNDNFMATLSDKCLRLHKWV